MVSYRGIACVSDAYHRKLRRPMSVLTSKVHSGERHLASSIHWNGPEGDLPHEEWVVTLVNPCVLHSLLTATALLLVSMGVWAVRVCVNGRSVGKPLLWASGRLGGCWQRAVAFVVCGVEGEVCGGRGEGALVARAGEERVRH